jgi:hypothetical protein
VTGSGIQPPGAEPRIRHLATAFGMQVECDWPLPGTLEVAGEQKLSLPTTRVRRVSSEAIRAAFQTPGEDVHEERFANGTVWFNLSRSADAYRFWVRDYGRHVISADGQLVDCDRGDSRERVERFVVAHGLPIAAVLQGYDVLHASAVTGPDGAAAFVGASGFGKTTLASRLIMRGAELVSDDVLTVEPRDNGLVAHAGLPFMAIRSEDMSRISEAGRLGTTVGTSDKVHVSPPTHLGEVPLRVMYHLEAGPELEISTLHVGDVRRLLGLAFMPYLMTSDRLSRHLEVAQLLGATVAHFRLCSPRGSVDERLLNSVESHMRTQGV